MNEKKVELFAEDAYSLLKVKAIEEVHSEVMNKLKKKLWVFGIVIAVVGFFGINGLVTMTIYGFLKEDLRSAQKASITAENTTMAAKSAIATISKLVEALEKQESDIKKRMESVLGKAEARSENVRAYSRQEITIVSDRIKQLEALVKMLAEKQPAQVLEYQTAVQSLNYEASQQRVRFDTNSNFTFELSFDMSSEAALSLGNNIKEKLSKEGFQAEGSHDLAEGILELGAIPENHIIVTDVSHDSGIYVQKILEPILGGRKLPIINTKEINWIKESPLSDNDPFFVVTLSKEGVL